METRSFLTRIVPAQGNYLTITWKSPAHGWAVRSYKLSQPDQIDEACRTLQWATSKGADCYFAIAAYNVAEVATTLKGAQIIKAKREQANVHLITHPGDGRRRQARRRQERPQELLRHQRDAVKWLLEFCKATGIPKPNLGVNSGYGLHLYWVLEDAVSLSTWQPMADALKSAMLAHGWVGDTSPTVDGARILRPPNTVNMKSGTPVPVQVIPGFTAADYANNVMSDALAPWLNVQARASGTGTRGASATVTSMLGPRPSHITPGVKLNPAAQAGLESRFSFAEIIKHCGQAKLSVDSRGLGAPYPGLVPGRHQPRRVHLDGKDFIHEFSDGDPRYKHVETEAAYARAAAERDAKGHGAPTCKHYNDHRPGVCGACPHNGKINSPLGLGAGRDDLPYGYRRGTGRLERLDGKGKDAEWVTLVAGNVSKPRLDQLSTGGHQVTFEYELAGKTYPVSAKDTEMGHQMPISYFTRQGMAVTRHTAPLFGDFVMAWISQLRVQQVTRHDVVRSFGWNFDEKGNRTGLAIAGTLYKTDGSEEAVAGGDPRVASMYRPAGDIAHWRKASSLFEDGRPDLQAMVAASFGAPLISLCGDVRGMSMNFWSTESGIGKSTAIKVGQSVWGEPKAMQSMQDTPNAVMKSLSEPRVLPGYWDELRVRKDNQDAFVEMIFIIPQGKEKARMQADTTLREVGEWETMLVFTSNRSCQDYLLARDDGTDSGLARLLEVEMHKIVTPFDPLVGQHIKLCETNYGHAGRVFAKYIATNLADVQAQLAKVMKAFSDKHDMQRDERFSATAITCILVGASIAKTLGLFNFDVRGIQDVLVRAFATQRSQRSSKTILSDTGGFDLEEVIAQFCYAQADYRVHTSAFSGPGVGHIRVFAAPRNNVVRLQISEAQKMLRIDRKSFAEWMRDHNRPGMTIIKEMVEKLGAKEHRKSIGGGSGMGTSIPTWVVDVPLVGKLSELLRGNVDDSDDVGSSGGLKKNPAKAARDAAD